MPSRSTTTICTVFRRISCRLPPWPLMFRRLPPNSLASAARGTTFLSREKHAFITTHRC
jgi:hypothetical protein